MGDTQPSNTELSARWIQHGMRCRDQKQWPEALEAFEKAVALDARNPQAWALKGRALDELNNLSEAIRCYKTSLELNPNSVRGQNSFPTPCFLPCHRTSPLLLGTPFLAPPLHPLHPFYQLSHPSQAFYHSGRKIGKASHSPWPTRSKNASSCIGRQQRTAPVLLNRTRYFFFAASRVWPPLPWELEDPFFLFPPLP